MMLHSLNACLLRLYGLNVRFSLLRLHHVHHLNVCFFAFEPFGWVFFAPLDCVLLTRVPFGFPLLGLLPGALFSVAFLNRAPLGFLLCDVEFLPPLGFSRC